MISKKFKHLIKYVLLGTIILPILGFMANYIVGILVRPEGMTVNHAVVLVSEYTLTLNREGNTFLKKELYIWMILGGFLGTITYIILSLKSKMKCPINCDETIKTNS